jgi:tetratricopeptide (TPR) repeat protein
MRRLLAVSGVILALAASHSAEARQQPQASAPKELTPEVQAKLKERDALVKRAVGLSRDGKHAHAIAAAEEAIAIEKEVHGPRHVKVGLAYLTVIGRWQVASEDWAGARLSFLSALDILRTAYGRDHWRVTDARLALEDVARIERLTADDRRDLKRADELLADAVQLRKQAQFAEAVNRAREARTIRERVLGPDHTACADAIATLGVICEYAEEHPQAIRLLRQSLEIWKRTVGEAHPDYVSTVGSLAAAYERLGDYARAGVLLRAAFRTARDAVGEEHEVYALTANSLGMFYLATGDYARAEPYLRKSQDVRRALFGDGSQSYATGLNNLALFYWNTGQFARAEPLFRAALDIHARVGGRTSMEFMQALSSVGQVYHKLGRTDAAESVLNQVIELEKKLWGRTTRDTR